MLLSLIHTKKNDIPSAPAGPIASFRARRTGVHCRWMGTPKVNIPSNTVHGLLLQTDDRTVQLLKQ